MLDEAHELVLGDFRKDFLSIKPIINNEALHAQRLCLSGTCDSQTALALAHRIDLDVRFSKFFLVPAAVLPRHEFSCVKLKETTYSDRCRTAVKKKVEAFVRKNNNVLPTGLVFVRQKKEAEEMCSFLQKHFHPSLVDFFHGAREASDVVLQKWMDGSVKIVVATGSSFGAGIHNAQCRFVINAGAPASLTLYKQQALRAGRDGRGAWICLFYEPGSCRQSIQSTFITPRDKTQVPRTDEEKIEAKSKEKSMEDEADAMLRYAIDRTCCRQALLGFGSKSCGLCDCCANNSKSCGDSPTQSPMQLQKRKDSVRLDITQLVASACEKAAATTSKLTFKAAIELFVENVFGRSFVSATCKAKDRQYSFPGNFAYDIICNLVLSCCSCSCETPAGANRPVCASGKFSFSKLPPGFQVFVDVISRSEAATALFRLLADRVIEPDQLKAYSSALDELDTHTTAHMTHMLGQPAADLVTTSAADGGDDPRAVRRPSRVHPPPSDMIPWVSTLPFVVQWSLDLVQQHDIMRYGNGLESLVHELYHHHTQQQHGMPGVAKEGQLQMQNELLQMIRRWLANAGKSPARCVPKDLEGGVWRYHALYTMRDGTPQLQLQLPEAVGYRRIFEKWGSDRFIFCKVQQVVANMGAQTTRSTLLRAQRTVGDACTCIAGSLLLRLLLNVGNNSSFDCLVALNSYLQRCLTYASCSIQSMLLVVRRARSFSKARAWANRRCRSFCWYRSRV